MKTGEGRSGGGIGAGMVAIHGNEYVPHSELPVPEVSLRRKKANRTHSAVPSLPLNWPVPLVAPD
uniref:hypothetical protein n=1 Tax=Undibacterium luofuense TaxID=2828733 RepID=UPI0030EBF635